MQNIIKQLSGIKKVLLTELKVKEINLPKLYR
jgi:hypothetical protein